MYTAREKRKYIIIDILLLFLVCFGLLLVSWGLTLKEENFTDNPVIEEKLTWPYSDEYIPSGGFDDNFQNEYGMFFYKKEMSYSGYVDYLKSFGSGFGISKTESSYSLFADYETDLNNISDKGYAKAYICNGVSSDPRICLDIKWYDVVQYKKNYGKTMDYSLSVMIKK